jgi:hypothetical protein
VKGTQPRAYRRTPRVSDRFNRLLPHTLLDTRTAVTNNNSRNITNPTCRRPYASQSSQTPDVVLCRCSIVCVIPMPTKPLYTQFCPFPALLRRAPCRSILINFLSFSVARRAFRFFFNVILFASRFLRVRHLL